MAYKKVKKHKALIKADKGVGLVNDKGFSEKVNDLSRKKVKRLHNDVISFLIEPISFWGEKNIVKLKYTSYIWVKRESYNVQIFSSKIVVRFKEDIVAKTIRECKELAERRIISFLKSFRYKGVNLSGERYEQVSRHYAILGTSIAKRFVREKKKFYVLDKDDGKSRLVIDYSHNKPEFEAEHSLKGLSDAQRSEAFFDDLINNDFDLPSVTKRSIDIILGIQLRHANNIELHLEVMQDIKIAIKELRDIFRGKK